MLLDQESGLQKWSRKKKRGVSIFEINAYQSVEKMKPETLTRGSRTFGAMNFQEFWNNPGLKTWAFSSFSSLGIFLTPYILIYEGSRLVKYSNLLRLVIPTERNVAQHAFDYVSSFASPSFSGTVTWTNETSRTSLLRFLTCLVQRTSQTTR